MPAEELETSWLAISLILLMILFAWGIISLFMRYQIKKNQLIQKNALLQSQYQQELLKTQLEIQEQTFKNISQEIHDNIGQALSFVKLNINTINVYQPEDTKEKLLESKKLITKTIQDLRDLSKTLNTDFIGDIGLVAAIEQQLFFLQKTGLYQTRFLVDGEASKQPMQTQIVLFRIVQELLNNTVKHAEATEVAVEIRFLPQKMSILVSDNGKGFHVAETTNGNNTPGLGFRNMQNRMAMVRGFITINSEPGKGTLALIELHK
ncbi:sensor histidine kinase [Foetidibacter luteolus]|uniref:sensor histidine kinase n=1 Tax=Foetidibacter luteolus TaxID=2608880 RepID=UPI00129BADAA|nr:ATP-binding protein [Foetidibacter luteolus]